MKEASGRGLFFDSIASDLLIGYGKDLHEWIAVDANLRAIPHQDLAALANSICRSCWPASNPSSYRHSELAQTVRLLSPYVIDGEGFPLDAVAQSVHHRLGSQAHGVIFNIVVNTFAITVIDYNPAQCGDIITNATHQLFAACSKQSDSLVTARYHQRGFTVFQQDYQLFERGLEQDVSDPIWRQRFYQRLGNVWRYSGRPVEPGHIGNWVEQFERDGFTNEACHILLYLYRYGYVMETKMVTSLLNAFERLSRGGASHPLAVTLQPAGKSESKLAYGLRPYIDFKSISDALEIARSGAVNGVLELVCFDDCIGSGETVERYFYDTSMNPLAANLSAALADGIMRLHVITYHSDVRGVARIQGSPYAHGAVVITTVVPLEESDRTFSDNSRILQDATRRSEFKEFCRAIGNHLAPNGPLGWGDCQWCVSYDYTIPDNSLPILSAESETSRQWLALFPRCR